MKRLICAIYIVTFLAVDPSELRAQGAPRQLASTLRDISLPPKGYSKAGETFENFYGGSRWDGPDYRLEYLTAGEGSEQRIATYRVLVRKCMGQELGPDCKSIISHVARILWNADPPTLSYRLVGRSIGYGSCRKDPLIGEIQSRLVEISRLFNHIGVIVGTEPFGVQCSYGYPEWTPAGSPGDTSRWIDASRWVELVFTFPTE